MIYNTEQHIRELEIKAINPEISNHASALIVNDMKILTRKLLGQKTGKMPKFCEGMVKLHKQFKDL